MNPNDLLKDAVLHVRRKDMGTHTHSLPEVLAILSDADAQHPIETFTHLMAHQRHPWHAFLVQVAAIALHHAGRTDLPTKPETWEQLLLNLTDGAREPWTLIVEDLAKPAFLQAPLADPSERPWIEEKTTAFPDTIDIVTAPKNHAPKKAVITNPAPDHWTYAMVSGQTACGWEGRTWYGSVRMNGLYGTRACVTFTPSLDWGPWVRRDIRALLGARDEIAARYKFARRNGLALTWLVPWDERTQIPLDALDPLFIEMTRQHRMAVEDGGIVALRKGTKNTRIAARDLKGVVGDPWLPVAKDGATAFNISDTGFPYEKVNALLVGEEWELGPVGQLQPTDPERVWFVARAVNRVKGGETQGYFERILEIPGQVTHRLRTPDGRDEMAKRSEAWVDRATKVRLQLLNKSLRRYCEIAGIGQIASGSLRKRARARFTAEVDEAFFPALWRHIEAGQAEAVLAWTEELIAIAEDELMNVLDHPTGSVNSRRKARALTERLFGGIARNMTDNLKVQINV